MTQKRHVDFAMRAAAFSKLPNNIPDLVEWLPSPLKDRLFLVPIGIPIMEPIITLNRFEEKLLQESCTISEERCGGKPHSRRNQSIDTSGIHIIYSRGIR